MSRRVKQKALTPAAGKRLIAKGLVRHPEVEAVLRSGTLVIIAGSTNGYVAEEILSAIGDSEGFSRARFFRGVTLPPDRPTTEMGRLPDEGDFPGDVVIVDGKWQRGKTIFDVVESLRAGDVVMKGANALDVTSRRAAVYIGHPKAGTIGAALQAVVGRRVRLILPVGLEKRVAAPLDELARLVNHPAAHGPRLLPVPGEVFSELDAVTSLTGAEAALVAGGGVCGAEGAVWLAVSGDPEQLRAAGELLRGVAGEPAFRL